MAWSSFLPLQSSGSRSVGAAKSSALVAKQTNFGAGSSRRQLSGNLLNLDDHELGGVERRKADEDGDDALVDARLRIVFRVALHKVGQLRCCSRECPLLEEPLHEGADVEPQLAP